MKIIIIDGQGGKIGTALVKQLKQNMPDLKLLVIGTNSNATAAMLKAGAEQGATGENPVVYNCQDADIIIGPIGIVSANAFLGELTPPMAQAIGHSKAQKILIPVDKCCIKVVGVKDLPLSDSIRLAIQEVKDIIGLQTC